MIMEMSKTYQYRKVMKPLLERKRRARINKCLDDLKDLMVECLTQEGEHVTRLEKADILELTVEHMRKLQQRGNLSLKSHSNAYLESFCSGYANAADHISNILMQRCESKEAARISEFLSGRLMEMQHEHVNCALKNFLQPGQVINKNLNYSNGSSLFESRIFLKSNIKSLSNVIETNNCCATNLDSSLTNLKNSTDSKFIWRPW